MNSTHMREARTRQGSGIKTRPVYFFVQKQIEQKMTDRYPDRQDSRFHDDPDDCGEEEPVMRDFPGGGVIVTEDGVDLYYGVPGVANGTPVSKDDWRAPE